MSVIDWKLVATLLALLLVLQLVCWILAQGLGLRLRRQAVAIGLALPLALLAPWLVGPELLAPCAILRDVPGVPATAPRAASPYDVQNDAVYQFLPWELEVRHALSRGRLPFWSDVIDGGCNLWANPQAGVLSPVQMLARAVPLQHHLLATIALKLLLCFEGAWLLCRRVGRSRIASLLAAGSFALGGGVMGWALFPHSSTLAWVPWLAAGVIGLFRRPAPRTIATTGVIAAALLLSGHPETALIGGLFAAGCGLCLCRRGSFRRGLLAATAAAGLGFALAAPHVLPFLHVLPESQRAQETLATGMPPHRVQVTNPVTWFLPRFAPFMLSPTNPHAYGRPFREPFRGPFVWLEAVNGYVGLLAFAGAMTALLALRDRRSRPFLAFAGASLLITARWLPFASFVHAVDLLRLPAYSRFLPVGSLALAVAAAFGFDRWRAQRKRWPVWISLTVAAAVSLLVRADPWVLALWALVAAAVAAARWSRLAWGAATLVLLLDLGPWSRLLLPACDPRLFYPRTPVTELLAMEAGAASEGRAVGALQLVFPSLLSVYDVADPRTHNPLAPMSYLEVLGGAFRFSPTQQTYFPPFLNLDHPLLDFLNVRVVLGSLALPPPATLERIDGGRFPPYQVYRNPDALPRWFLTDRTRVIERAEVRGWIEGLKDPREVAVFPDAGTWRPTPGTAGKVDAVSLTPGHLVLRVPAAGAKLLATSLPAAPGWRAEGSSGSLSTLTINAAFLGAAIPAGESRVALRFRPPGFSTGLLLAAVAVLAIGWLYWRTPRGGGRSHAKRRATARPAVRQAMTKPEGR